MDTEDVPYVFDLHSIIGFKPFMGKFKDNKYLIKLYFNRDKKYEYDCSLLLQNVPGKKLYFEAYIKDVGKENTFLQINSKGEGFIDLANKDGTRNNISCIDRFKPLDTVFYIRTMFYRMVGIEDLTINDSASFICSDGSKYSALNYNIFLTDKPLHKLSIYFKYYKKIDGIFDKFLIQYRGKEKEIKIDNEYLVKTLLKIRDIFRIEIDKFFKDETCPKIAEFLRPFIYNSFRMTINNCFTRKY